MFWYMIIAVVLISSASKAYQMRLKHVETRLKIEQKVLQNQIELEKIKQENFVLETQKLRLELNDEINKAPSKTELLEYPNSEKIS